MKKGKKAPHTDLSPFDFVTYIKNNKDLSDEELKNFNPYLINKLYYYSGQEMTASFLNYYWDIPKDLQYKLFRTLYNKVKDVKWIKSKKKKDK